MSRGRTTSPEAVRQMLLLASGALTEGQGLDPEQISEELGIPARTVYKFLTCENLLGCDGEEINGATESAILLDYDAGTDYKEIMKAFNISLTVLLFLIRQSGKSLKITGGYTRKDSDTRLKKAIEMYYELDEEGDFKHRIVDILAETGVSPSTISLHLAKNKLKSRNEIKREKAED